MVKYVVTCVLALVFGFGGAFVAVAVMQDSLTGPQGETGLTGDGVRVGVLGSVDGFDHDPLPDGRVPQSPLDVRPEVGL